MTTQIELPLEAPKPRRCEICYGEEVEMRDSVGNVWLDDGPTQYWVACLKCSNCCGPRRCSVDEAVMAWNELMESLDLPF